MYPHYTLTPDSAAYCEFFDSPRHFGRVTHTHTPTHHSVVTMENKNIYTMKIPESQRVIVKSSDHCYWVLYRDVLIGGP